MNRQHRSTAAEVSRLVRWEVDMAARRRQGKTVGPAELVDYQRAKVALLSLIAEREPSEKADQVLAAARAQLVQYEAARRRGPEVER
jgi:hypothetical protein